MVKYLSVIAAALLAGSAYAQEVAADTPPSETVSLFWVALFGIVFVGMIVGFIVYLWWNERERK